MATLIRKLTRSTWLLIIFATFSQNAAALGWWPANSSGAPTGIPGKKITSMYSGSIGNRTSVSLDAFSASANGCVPTAVALDGEIDILPTNPKFREIWNSLLMAHALGRTVYVFLSGCGGAYNLPILTDVKVTDQ